MVAFYEIHPQLCVRTADVIGKSQAVIVPISDGSCHFQISTLVPWLTVNDPNASTTPAFDVTGTTINGLNDNSQLVGFFSDGTNVNGFLATLTPEPPSIALLALGTALILIWRKSFNRAR